MVVEGENDIALTVTVLDRVSEFPPNILLVATQLIVYEPEVLVLRLPELYTGVFVVSATTLVTPPSVYVPHCVSDWLPPFSVKLAVAALVLYT
jgi:hypothetical protein|tara:strand:+ start:203 stop:481 length:279 start_codon:yes stop_codon:yes gene_type:complete